jgi:hypothetical protein
MKKVFYILILFAGFLSACNHTENKTHSVPDARLLPEPDILERLKSQKAVIDTLFNHSKDSILVFAKLVDKDEPVPVKNGYFPVNVEMTYNILKDSSGRILTISAFLYSESGDWNIILTHYFDGNGKTFAFERQTNFFNSICTEGVAFETQTEYYDSDFVSINKTYTLVDEKNNILQKDSCYFPYNYPVTVSAYIGRYLQDKRIQPVR